MTQGVVKFFDAAKGFGFIAPDGGAGDVFVHVKKVQRGTELNKGMRVVFETAPGRKGLEAFNVRADLPGEIKVVFVLRQHWQGREQLMSATGWRADEFGPVLEWGAELVSDPNVTPGVWEVETWGRGLQVRFIRKIVDEEEMLLEAETELRAKVGGWFEGEVRAVLANVFLKHPFGARVYRDHELVQRLLWDAQKAALSTQEEVRAWIWAKLDNLQLKQVEEAGEDANYPTRWGFFGLEVEVDGVWRSATYDAPTKVITVRPLTKVSRERTSATASYGGETWATGGPDFYMDVTEIVAPGFTFTRELTRPRHWGGLQVESGLFINGRSRVWGLVDLDTKEVVSVWSEKRQRWAKPISGFSWERAEGSLTLSKEKPFNDVYWLYFHQAHQQGLVIQ